MPHTPQGKGPRLSYELKRGPTKKEKTIMKLEELKAEHGALVTQIEKALEKADKLKSKKALKDVKSFLTVFNSYHKTDESNLYYHDSFGQQHFIDHKNYFRIVRENLNAIQYILEN